MTEYRRKYLGGLLPFWPTYPAGYFLRLALVEFYGVARGESGRRYMAQRGQSAGPALRLIMAARQAPKAFFGAIVDEVRNVVRSRHNRRVVGQ